jgi:4'-phosphopantetheinyl transferase
MSMSDPKAEIWTIQLDHASIQMDLCEEVLSTDEQERAAKFKFQRDRRRYIVAHATLRSILAAHMTKSPQELTFTHGKNGKPYLAGTDIERDIQFNLTHSHEVALLAVTRGQEIGVDVEYMNRDFAFTEVAERFFTASEVQALLALPVPLQKQAFYKCWTSKEAFLKAKGTGLSGELGEVTIELIDNHSVKVKATLPDWSLTELMPCDGYVGALVLEGVQPQLKYFTWQPGNWQSS